MNESVTKLPGVGPRRAEALAKLGIRTIEDLLRHYPRRYEDRRKAVPVSSLVDGAPALTRVCVYRVAPPPAFARGGMAPRIPMKVFCRDESGEMTLLFFNARWLTRAFQVGAEYWVYGTAHRELTGTWMAHPDFEPAASGGAEDEGPDAGARGAGIAPVYPLTAGISQKYLRGLVRAALPSAGHLPEILPQTITSGRRLAPGPYALKHIHFPEDEHALNAAKYRLVYEEFFLMQIRLLYVRRGAGAGAEAGVSTCKRGLGLSDAAALFPYELTGAQRRVIEEVRLGMAQAAPMNRLIQGDVGSGKTAVAVAAAYFAARSGFQTAIMAPTEILAAQHYKEFERLLGGAGIRVALITAGLSSAQKNEAREGLRTGGIDIAVGTHALIEPDISFAGLGLVITDEQHRFGVRQRLLLRQKGESADTLVMTATPIPRTLALMLYADLDLSVLDEIPPGRKPVATRFIDSAKRDAAYDFAGREISGGRQVYVVASMIGDEEAAEEAESFPGAPEDAGSLEGEALGLSTALGLAEEMAERFPGRSVACLHGRLKSEQKEDIMARFAGGLIDILVSTVVIEVGVNVPNATIMIVENAERFGLAQLHQLRGRVGRGAAKSYCVLVSDSKAELSTRRLETLAREKDGFRIAELDLSLRGPGDLFGVRQHGLPEFKIADTAKHMDILLKANKDARALLEGDPGLGREENAALRRFVDMGLAE